MDSKYVQTDVDLQRHLDDHLQFLILSAKSFDDGIEAEAKRMATTIRVLVHDTSKCISLMTQLRRNDTLFYDSSEDEVSGNLASHSPLVHHEFSNDGIRYVAPLDGESEFKRLSFMEWWNRVIFVDGQGRRLTRKALVLTVADQDGGAHVDPTLEVAYAELSRRNSLGWVAVKGESHEPLLGAERFAIRQICHEVLKSLIPGYSNVRRLGDGAIVVGGFTIEDITDQVPKPATGANVTNIGVRRMQLCTCGSGKRFKHCHGRLAP